MVYKEKYFNKFVDEIMSDGVERFSSAIIELLKESMSSNCPEGRNRTGHYVPQMRVLTYYLRISDKYILIDKGTGTARWKKVNEYDNK
tara:strand:+ start:365 stop:628 length:264 start_codon:yes stop_codon:yes gene_type:complete